MRTRLGAILLLIGIAGSVAAMGPTDPGGFIPPLPTCFDDAFEDIGGDDANLTASPEWLMPVSLDDRRVCPGDDDWYPFFASEGGEISVQVAFDTSQGDIDIELAEPWSHQVVTGSYSAGLEEQISYTTTTSGRYALRVFQNTSVNPAPFGVDYRLELDASCPPAIVDGTTFGDAMSGPLPIPDNGEVPGAPAIRVRAANCIQIDQDIPIDDVDVAVDISHPWVDDLAIFLHHHETIGTGEVGKDTVLYSGIDCSGDNINAIFDEDAERAASDACDSSTPAVGGRLRPLRPVELLEAGHSTLGRWTLYVLDREAGAQGTLDSWSLTFNDEAVETPGPTETAGPSATPTPVSPGETPTEMATLIPAGLVGDLDCSGVVNAIDAAVLLQSLAGLLQNLPCPENADTNEDGSTNSIDAALILQFTAGLIPNLPV